MDTTDCVFGKFGTKCRGRLQLTYDYEMSAILTFKEVMTTIGATCVLDIGANIGVYSIYCLGVPTIKQIQSFEPAPASYEILCENINLQQPPCHIQAHQIAVSNRAGSVPFRIVEPTSGTNSIIADEQPSDDSIIVEAATIDSLIQLEKSVLGIKIDVEGHEVHALQGMVQLLKQNVGYLQIEILEPNAVRDVEAILLPLGYCPIFRLRDDYLFLHGDLDEHRPAILKTISDMLAFDLRDLVHLRREKRAIARAAKSLREMSGYRRDPLLIPIGDNPFK